jgi:hypothetical protein
LEESWPGAGGEVLDTPVQSSLRGFGLAAFGDRERLRAQLGYGEREQVCIVTVRRLGRAPICCAG